MGTRVLRCLVGALAVFGVVFLLACGSDDDAASGGGGGDAAAGAETTESTDPAEGSDAGENQSEGVFDYVAYTRGTAGAADTSKEPYTIGFVNTEGGSIPPIGPQTTPATNFAVKYINEKLGGIDGHPLELSRCYVKNAEEEGLQCAQKFLNDPKIDLIAFGAVSVGAETIERANDGKKVIIPAFSVSESDVTAKNTWALYTSGSFATYAWGTFGRDVLKAKSNAIIYPDVPGFVGLAEGVKRGSEAAGLKTKMVAFDPNSTDLLGAFTAAGVQDSDMVSPLIDGKYCVAAVKALATLNVPEDHAVGFTTCVSDPKLKDQYPNKDFPKWYYGQGQSGDALLTNKAGNAWRAALKEYGLEENARNDWWTAMFGQTLTIAQFLNEIAKEQGGVDKITPEHIAEKAKNLQGPLLLGGSKVQCGKYPDMPATCTDGAFFTKYEGDGRFSRETPWTQTPIELQKELGATGTE